MLFCVNFRCFAKHHWPLGSPWEHSFNYHFKQASNEIIHSLLTSWTGNYLFIYLTYIKHNLKQASEILVIYSVHQTFFIMEIETLSIKVFFNQI